MKAIAAGKPSLALRRMPSPSTSVCGLVFAGGSLDPYVDGGKVERFHPVLRRWSATS